MWAHGIDAWHQTAMHFPALLAAAASFAPLALARPLPLPSDWVHTPSGIAAGDLADVPHDPDPGGDDDFHDDVAATEPPARRAGGHDACACACAHDCDSARKAEEEATCVWWVWCVVRGELRPELDDDHAVQAKEPQQEKEWEREPPACTTTATATASSSSELPEQPEQFGKAHTTTTTTTNANCVHIIHNALFKAEAEAKANASG